ncbi:MAG: response regulator [Proteobacteria bacterium]|nr:response regulator [Pseudomonadota bacterium]
MNAGDKEKTIRVLIADDDDLILDCYREAFVEPEDTHELQVIDALAAELFDVEETSNEQSKFQLVECSQGEDAVSLVKAAADQGDPFDVVILDVRMPPGIDGVEAGCQIRELDPNVEIVFVTGYSDMPIEEMQRRVPPAMKMHHFSKPLSFTQLAQDVATMVTPTERCVDD